MSLVRSFTVAVALRLGAWAAGAYSGCAGRLPAGGVRTFNGLGRGHSVPKRVGYLVASALIAGACIFGANGYGFALFYSGAFLALWNRVRSVDRAIPVHVDGGFATGGVTDCVSSGGASRE